MEGGEGRFKKLTATLTLFVVLIFNNLKFTTTKNYLFIKFLKNVLWLVFIQTTCRHSRLKTFFLIHTISLNAHTILHKLIIIISIDKQSIIIIIINKFLFLLLMIRRYANRYDDNLKLFYLMISFVRLSVCLFVCLIPVLSMEIIIVTTRL